MKKILAVCLAGACCAAGAEGVVETGKVFGEPRSVPGTSPRIMATLMSNMGADAIGVNCSLGPRDLKPIVEELLQYSDKPVLVQPNRGLPYIHNGKACYTLSERDFAETMSEFQQAGVDVLGGCCGTNPDFIRAIAVHKGKQVPERKVVRKTVITSATKYLTMEGIQVCGERINPTGKKKLKEAIVNEDFDYIFKEAIKQETAKADLLDVNLGVPKTDDVKPAVVTATVCRSSTP